MGWLKSRRLHYWLGATAILFVLFALLRVLFFFGYSGFDAKALGNEDVLTTLGIGFRFDLRLAILVMLPVALLAWIPRWNLVGSRLLRIINRLYLVAILSAVLLIYIIDFGHYAYLGVRINATVLRFIEDAQISRDMVWQTYPVIWITLGWLATVLRDTGPGASGTGHAGPPAHNHSPTFRDMGRCGDGGTGAAGYFGSCRKPEP